MDHESGLRRGKRQPRRRTGVPRRRFRQLLSEDKTPIEMIEENEMTRRGIESPRALKGHALREPRGNQLLFK